MEEKDTYQSPFSTRYASEYMLHLFSENSRYRIWRKLWYELARIEKKLGLDISDMQLKELKEHIEDIDYDAVRQKEREVRHDVMAHIHAYGKAAPLAAGIIHLGATSCYVTDNADLILYRDGLLYLRKELLKAMRNLSDFVLKTKDIVCLSYTHYQPAQPTTVGKRACLWLEDLAQDLDFLDYVLSQIRFLGCRGTTGTEASFLELFDQNREKIDILNKELAGAFGFESCYAVTGQTYPRKTDILILDVLAMIAQSAYRFGQDIRLLQHDAELEEPFESGQVGSSAMAYKRNPMRSERICSLARYLMSDALNPVLTASGQWLERTLDDSANRRISMPEAFLCADAILRLVQNVAAGLSVNETVIQTDLKRELPFLITENLLMEAVKNGGDRQMLHETIRKCSMEAVTEVRKGKQNRLLEKLAESGFPLSLSIMQEMMETETLSGRAAEQAENYVKSLMPLFEKLEQTSAEIEI